MLPLESLGLALETLVAKQSNLAQLKWDLEVLLLDSKLILNRFLTFIDLPPSSFLSGSNIALLQLRRGETICK